jgi:protein gp37
MHYMTRRTHWMQKRNFGVTCLGALFMGSVTVPPVHEKYHVNISCPGHTGMHYVTRRTHRMQTHKFCITCPDAIFVEYV